MNSSSRSRFIKLSALVVFILAAGATAGWIAFEGRQPALDTRVNIGSLSSSMNSESNGGIADGGLSPSTPILVAGGQPQPSQSPVYPPPDLSPRPKPPLPTQTPVRIVPTPDINARGK